MAAGTGLALASPALPQAEERWGAPPHAKAAATLWRSACLATMRTAMAAAAQRTAAWAAKTTSVMAVMAAMMARVTAMMALVAAEVLVAARLPKRAPSVRGHS